jgi:type II secretory pathway pseudopilin PulG
MTEKAMANASPDPDRKEAGFTLVEALVAIIVLVFGLIAVTNLLLVAASSNSVANQSSVATMDAAERLDLLRNLPFVTLAAAVGGDITDTTMPATDCVPAAGAAPPMPPAAFACFHDLQGVGRVVTRWQISAVPGTGRLIYIQVRSEGTGALSQARSRSDFAVVRACTDSSLPAAAGATVAACPAN